MLIVSTSQLCSVMLTDLRIVMVAALRAGGAGGDPMSAGVTGIGAAAAAELPDGAAAMCGSVIQIRPQAARPPQGCSQQKHRQCDRGFIDFVSRGNYRLRS
jgi:hypothetical protein